MRDLRPSRKWTLTEWEWLGLRQSLNVADGHAHYDLDVEYGIPISELLESLIRSDLDQVRTERQFLESYAAISGQSIDLNRVTLHYSSSVTIEMCAKVLRDRGHDSISVITPTFDNIPLLFRRTGLRLRPIDEADLWSISDSAINTLDDTRALFVVVPNNPTGTAPTREVFERLSSVCAERGILLICDFSFRLYTDYHLWDQYSYADSLPGLDYIFVEDTGKVYSAGELKVGFGITSRSLEHTMRQMTDELLLNVSPFILNVLSQVVQNDYADCGNGAGRRTFAGRIVDANSAALRLAVASLPEVEKIVESTISVAWLKLRHPTADEFCADWAERGVVALPGMPFYWDDPKRGESYVRVALARNRSIFSTAMAALTESEPRDRRTPPCSGVSGVDRE